MKRVWDFMGTLTFVALVSIPSIILTAYVAWQGDHTSIVILTCWALIGMGTAVGFGAGWRSSNEGWRRSNSGWAEQEQLTLDLTHLLSEALDNLSTWDREASDDIAERTNTVIRLRFQNFQESDRKELP